MHTAALEGVHGADSTALTPALARLASVLESGGRAEEALEAFAAALSLRPTFFEVLLDRGIMGEGCANLAEMYFLGKGVPKDIKTGLQLTYQACQLGDQPACEQLEEIQKYEMSMSKYVADQVDTSRKVLKALKMYRGY